jgi:phenylacetic acid degradation operon negative regulatory protein
MGEFLLPTGGVAWTSTFIDVLGRFGIESGTVRQALARTASAGWLSPERVGRRTRWRITSAGEQLLVAGTKRIYEFAGPTLDWDGRWLLVLVSVPEGDRAGRHLVRSRLSWAGLGSPAPGVWVGTHPERVAEVEDVLTRAGIIDTAQVFAAEHLGSTRVQAIVAASWDLKAIDAEYQQFIAEFSSRATKEPLTRLLELVHAWRRFPWRDPALPRELLPADWKGADAAALFHDRHERWTSGANEAWSRISV